MTIIFIIIGIIALLLSAYILFMPVKLRASIIIDESVSAVSSLTIFPFRYTIHPKPQKTPGRATKKKREKKDGVIKKKPLDISLLNASDGPTIFKIAKEALRLMGRLIQAPDYFLVANITGGAAEPDITGQLYGAYHAIRPNLPAGIQINYVPDFTAERFKGDISVGLAVRIFGILRETIAFIFRLPILRLIKLYRKLKKGRNDGK